MNEHTLGKLKAILQGRIQACMDTCLKLPLDDADARAPLVQCTLQPMDSLLQMELTPKEQATTYRAQGDALLLCQTPPDVDGAIQSRLALYQFIQPHEFESTARGTSKL